MKQKLDMKRLFLISLVATLVLAGCNSKRCEIDGRLGNFRGEGMIYITDNWNQKVAIDSTTVVQGVFHFDNVKAEPTLASLVGEDGSHIATFFIEEGKISISGDAAEYNVKGSGTPSNDAFNSFMAQRQEFKEKFGKAMQSGDEAAIEAVDKEYEAMSARYQDENSGNIFGIFMLKQRSYSENSHTMLNEIAKLPQELQELKVVKSMKAEMEQRRKTEPQAEGSDFVPHYIDIVQPTTEGVEVSLKSVVENKSNRYVLLDFWASWCGPCKRELPHLTEAYAKYHKKGFEIYGVSFDRDAEAWKKAIKEYKLNWVNVSTVTSFNNQAADDYAVSSIPTNFLIDCSNGVIIAKNLRGEEVIKKLEELLK